MPTPHPAECTLVPVRLLCEGQADPVALHDRRPRLSWNVEPVDPRARGLAQSAYRIVATAAGAPADAAPLWDSGRVLSADSLFIEYGGPALESRQTVEWRVTVWDAAGAESAPSGPARFTMGLLEPADWTARWIESPDMRGFSRCGWWWHPEEPASPKGAKARTAVFVREIPAGAVARATLGIVADDRWRVFVDGAEVAASPADAVDQFRVSTTVDLTPHLTGAAPRRLALAVTNATDGAPAGVAAKVALDHADGTRRVMPLDSAWRVTFADDAGPSVARTAQAYAGFVWADAFQVGHLGGTDPYTQPLTPWGTPDRDDALTLPPPTVFRASFELPAKPRRALLHATALGVYEARINGRDTSPTDDRFAPGWPDYAKRLYYQQRDVTDLLAAGGNTLMAVLADGWHSGYLAWGRVRDRYGADPKLMMQIDIEHADGRHETVAATGAAVGTAGRAWEAVEGGPWRAADMLMGEEYDARIALPGWNAGRAENGAATDELAWRPAALSSESPAVPLEGYVGQPVRPTEVLAAIASSEPDPGAHVYDLGQNMVGVARLRLPAEMTVGTRVTLRHAEVLTDEGRLYTEALRGARCTDVYIKGATGTAETFEPRFTFHGFRFVEVTMDPPGPRLPLEAVSGVVLHTDWPRTGDMATDDPLVNRLFENIRQGQRGNGLEVPTDCPQRDERLGWTGDGQIFIGTASFNYDVSSFFGRYCQAMADGLSPEGWFRYVAPAMDQAPNEEICAAGWADAGIVCPWVLWRRYGDLGPAARAWTEMTRYIEYLERTSDGLLRPDAGFGDWLSLNADTPKDLVATAYFAWDATLMADMADALGKPAEAARHRELHGRVRAAWRAAYLGGDGWVKGNTQTGYALALRFGLLDPAERPLALRHLTRDLAYRGGHFSTGFMGLRDVLPALSDGGRADLVYKIIQDTTFPGWGYEIRHGATTIWERWDGWSDDLGLQTPEMNSFNHYSLGSVGDWMYRVMAGIDELEPGFRRIRIAPEPTTRLRFVRASFASPMGPVATAWRLSGAGVFSLDVRIPANTTALLRMPCRRADEVTEGGRPVETSGAGAPGVGGIVAVGTEPGAALLHLGSGHYSFSAPWTPSR